MIFFSRVLHNENHVLHPLLPNETTMVIMRRRRHERGYTSNDANRKNIYRQLHKYTTNFPPANFYCLIAICQFIISGKRICYIV